MSPLVGHSRNDILTHMDWVDSFHNYMDYSDDSCMNNFTPGQCTRLKSQIATYRGIS